ncbi:MAG: hypothetical protein AB1806_17905 [Acidobacteriota bacterium]
MMRISFDLDGVLADMDSALARIAEREFGRKAGTRDRGAATGSVGSKTDAVQESGAAVPGPWSPVPDPDAAAAPPGSAAIIASLTARQQVRLWQVVRETTNFWESLAEHEPGSVSRLQKLAQELRWDVLFVTQRPSTSGHTAQIQSQRWLRRHGYNLPSVFTTQGSRGRIAAALTLDAHVDDRLENCVDVATDSQTWPILVWRDDASFERIAAGAGKLNVAVVRSVREALDRLEEADRSGETPAQSRVVDRLKRAFGL